MPFDSFRKLRPWLFLLMAVYWLGTPAPFARASALENAADVHSRAVDLKTRGYYGKAASIMDEALAMDRKASGGRSREAARSLDTLGELHYLAGRYDAAEPLLKESLSIKEGLYGSKAIETALTFGRCWTLRHRN
jgi:tetratricopeptide (TPR) repeat protein